MIYDDVDLLSTWFPKWIIEHSTDFSSRHSLRWNNEELTLITCLSQKHFTLDEIEQFLEYTRPKSGIKKQLDRLNIKQFDSATVGVTPVVEASPSPNKEASPSPKSSLSSVSAAQAAAAIVVAVEEVAIASLPSSMSSSHSRTEMAPEPSSLALSPLAGKYDFQDDISLWLKRWLRRKAASLAAKDTRLASNTDNIIYKTDQILPHVIACVQASPERRCYFCRRFLMLATYGNCSRSTLASFDHLIPRISVLAPGNQFNLTCLMCNFAKHTLTMNQFQQFIDQVRCTDLSSPMVPLHAGDEIYIRKENSRIHSDHVQLRKKYGVSMRKDHPPNQEELLALAKTHGLNDPYTNIKGHYGPYEGEEAFRLVFGRKLKKDATSVIHGFYLDNLQPMLRVVKYASHTFTEDEIISWINSIRRSGV